MNLLSLEEALVHSWGKDTCFPLIADHWSSTNPAYGQCAVTALLVHDYLGGTFPFSKDHNHFWNRTFLGVEVDFTKMQFDEGLSYRADELWTRDEILDPIYVKAKTLDRYMILKSRVTQYLETIH